MQTTTTTADPTATLASPIEAAAHLGYPTLIADEEEEPKGSRLRQIRDEVVKGLSDQAMAFTREAARRLRRYRWTRISVVVLMLSGLLSVFFTNGLSIGFDNLLTRLTPVMITCAVIFYVVEAFFRDYEVGLQSSKEAERLSSFTRDVLLDWEIKDADEDPAAARAILERLRDFEMHMDTVVEAERVPPLPVLYNLLKNAERQAPVRPIRERSTKSNLKAK